MPGSTRGGLMLWILPIALSFGGCLLSPTTTGPEPTNPAAGTGAATARSERRAAAISAGAASRDSVPVAVESRIDQPIVVAWAGTTAAGETGARGVAVATGPMSPISPGTEPKRTVSLGPSRALSQRGGYRPTLAELAPQQPDRGEAAEIGAAEIDVTEIDAPGEHEKYAGLDLLAAQTAVTHRPISTSATEKNASPDRGAYRELSGRRDDEASDSRFPAPEMDRGADAPAARPPVWLLKKYPEPPHCCPRRRPRPWTLPAP